MKEYHLTKRQARIIEEAWENRLDIEFPFGKRLRIHLMQPEYLEVTCIDFVEGNSTVTHIVDKVSVSAWGTLVIRTKEGIMIEFKTIEDKDSEGDE